MSFQYGLSFGMHAAAMGESTECGGGSSSTTAATTLTTTATATTTAFTHAFPPIVAQLRRSLVAGLGSSPATVVAAHSTPPVATATATAPTNTPPHLATLAGWYLDPLTGSATNALTTTGPRTMASSRSPLPRTSSTVLPYILSRQHNDGADDEILITPHHDGSLGRFAAVSATTPIDNDNDDDDDADDLDDEDLGDDDLDAGAAADYYDSVLAAEEEYIYAELCKLASRRATLIDMARQVQYLRAVNASQDGLEDDLDVTDPQEWLEAYEHHISTRHTVPDEAFGPTVSRSRPAMREWVSQQLHNANDDEVGDIDSEADADADADAAVRCSICMSHRVTHRLGCEAGHCFCRWCIVRMVEADGGFGCRCPQRCGGGRLFTKAPERVRF